MAKNKDLKRKNIYIPGFVNDWLEKEAEKRGLYQSTLISLIIQERIKQEKAMDSISDLDKVIAELKKLKED